MDGHVLSILFMSLFFVAKGKGPIPEVSVEVDGDSVGIICSLPVSAKPNSTCFLYLATHRILTTSVWGMTRNEHPFCKFFISMDDLQRKLDAVETKVISCKYSLENGRSPRSDGYNMNLFTKNVPMTTHHVTTAALESEKTTNPHHVTGSETKATSTVFTTNVPMTTLHVTTAALETTNPRHVTRSEPKATSTVSYSEKPVTTTNTIITSDTIMTEAKTLTSSVQTFPSSTPSNSILTMTPQPTKSGTTSSMKRLIWKWLILLTLCGVVVGAVLLTLAILFTKRTNVQISKSSDDINPDTINPQDQADVPVTYGAYSLAIYATPGKRSAGFEGNRKQPQSQVQSESNVYHLYASISDEPHAGAVDNSSV